jgi:hypothetical protein
MKLTRSAWKMGFSATQTRKAAVEGWQSESDRSTRVGDACGASPPTTADLLAAQFERGPQVTPRWALPAIITPARGNEMRIKAIHT